MTAQGPEAFAICSFALRSQVVLQSDILSRRFEFTFGAIDAGDSRSLSKFCGCRLTGDFHFCPLLAGLLGFGLWLPLCGFCRRLDGFCATG